MTSRRNRIGGLIVLSLVLPGVLAALAATAEEKSTEPAMNVRVYSVPAGAKILVDGKELGISPGLFEIEPTARRITVELDSRDSQTENAPMRAGRIAWVSSGLTKRRGSSDDDESVGYSPPEKEWVEALFRAGVPIQVAVDRFNQEQNTHRQKCGQPPLTTQELVAALRLSLTRDAHRLDAERRHAVQKTLKSNVLPKGAELCLTTGWQHPDGFYYQLCHITVSYFGMHLDVRQTLLSSELR